MGGRDNILVCLHQNPAMKTIFLEAHHLKNLYFGFGQFNLHLLKSIGRLQDPDLQFVIHANNSAFFKKEFGGTFQYKRFYALRRYPAFRIRKTYDLWHSLNQNTHIEPHDTRMPYLLTVHNTPFVRNPDDYKTHKEHVKFQDKLYRSQAITYISEFARSSTHRWYDVPNVPEFVIYNGNPVAHLELPESHRPAYMPERPFLFSIGEITGRKNFMSLAQMMPLLPDFELVIAGKNSTRDAAAILEFAAANGLADRIKLPGKIGDADKLWYYQNSKAFVFPSLREGFGLPIIEAMRFGKPVFSSNLTSLPEIGGDLATYWNNFEPEYMAQTVVDGLKLFESQKDLLIPKMVERANSFSWDNAARQYLDVYRKML